MFIGPAEDAVLSAGPAVPLLRRRLAARGCAAGGDRPRRQTRSKRSFAASPMSMARSIGGPRRQPRAGAAVADHLRRRRRTALLVLGGAGAAQPNYAQVIDRGRRQARHHAAGRRAPGGAEREVAGARVDVRQLETGAPVGIPVSIRVSGEDIADAARAGRGGGSDSSRRCPLPRRVRDNWGPESFAVRLDTDSDKANLSGLTNSRRRRRVRHRRSSGVAVADAARGRRADSGGRAPADGRARAAVRHPQPLRLLRAAGRRRCRSQVDLVDRLRACRPRSCSAATSSAPSRSRPSRRAASCRPRC